MGGGLESAIVTDGLNGVVMPKEKTRIAEALANSIEKGGETVLGSCRHAGRKRSPDGSCMSNRSREI